MAKPDKTPAAPTLSAPPAEKKYRVVHGGIVRLVDGQRVEHHADEVLSLSDEEAAHFSAAGVLEPAS